MSFYKIRPRSGTKSQWETANTVLAEREIGYELPDEGIGTGLVKMKMGNGVTPWNDLPYAVSPQGEVVDNLESESATLPLSAKQGKVLDEKISEQNKKIGNVFSTEEVKTNDTWIDGKPLYRKVIHFGTLPDKTSKTVNHNITNIDIIMADTSHCFGYNPYGDFYPIPFVFVNSSDASTCFGFSINKTGIKVTTASNRSDINAYFTVLYTKTTD